jgi:hypothetical protein
MIDSRLDGPQSANLGFYTSNTVDPATGTISFVYTGGDTVQGTPRAALINLTCNASAGLITTTQFIQPNGHEPNQPYWYTVVAQSKLICMSFFAFRRFTCVVLLFLSFALFSYFLLSVFQIVCSF